MSGLAVIVRCIAPYHESRLRVAAARGDITAVEIAAADRQSAWTRAAPSGGYARRTLFDGDVDAVGGPAQRAALRTTLDELSPEAVAVPGWHEPVSLCAMRWCGRRRVPVVLMSDSTERDQPRTAWKEAVKRRILAGCAAAFVAGTRHADYLAALGMPRGLIATGYDVVDNAHFAAGADAARADPGARARLGLPAAYLLACGRLVARKNHAALMRAFARHAAAIPEPRWHLVIVGDGSLRQALHDEAASLGIADRVHLLGARSYGELPAIYGLAEAFVHPSDSEQWGLVVNEAMAAGLPVAVSEACGCADDLVGDGNGLRFAPSEAGVAEALARLAAAAPRLRAMGEESRRRIAAWSPTAFADGIWRAVSLCDRGRSHGMAGRLLLSALERR